MEATTSTPEISVPITDAPKTFSVADYLVFGALFLVSALIGLFFAIRDRNKKTSEDYLLAGRKMSGWPVALSLTASFMSAITVLGTPAETYRYGTMFWWFFVSYTLVAIITANVFLPVFYKMGISSTYEYLERRFSKAVRIAGTCAFILQTVLYMGMVMYMPALALNKVTGLSLTVSIVVTAVVCTFYTTIGGMKAVVWNDVVQCFVMWIGFTAIIIKGSIDVGGFDKVFQIANEGGRIDFWHFDFDPRVRHSFWSICIGGTLMWLSVYAINQSMVQRYLSCRNIYQAKLSLYLNDLGLLFVISLAMITGLVMYAVYANCDPLANGDVTKSDQLVPYLVLDILSVAPGIPGIFVASAYSGKPFLLSTVSTGINALACSTYEDLIKPIRPGISSARALTISKVLVVVYGLLGLGVAYLASLMDRILTMALKMFGIIGGPMLGIFCLGLFTPVGNSTGALVGLIGGLTMGIWMGIGSTLYPPADEFIRLLPVTTENCTSAVVASALNATVVPGVIAPSGGLIDSLYALSYCHYSTFLVLFTWSLGLLVSLITGGLSTRHNVMPDLLAFPGDICCCVGTKGCSCSKKKPGYSKGNQKEEYIIDQSDST